MLLVKHKNSLLRFFSLHVHELQDLHLMSISFTLTYKNVLLFFWTFFEPQCRLKCYKHLINSTVLQSFLTNKRKNKASDVSSKRFLWMRWEWRQNWITSVTVSYYPLIVFLLRHLENTRSMNLILVFLSKFRGTNQKLCNKTDRTIAKAGKLTFLIKVLWNNVFLFCFFMFVCIVLVFSAFLSVLNKDAPGLHFLKCFVIINLSQNKEKHKCFECSHLLYDDFFPFFFCRCKRMLEPDSVRSG